MISRRKEQAKKHKPYSWWWYVFRMLYVNFRHMQLLPIQTLIHNFLLYNTSSCSDCWHYLQLSAASYNCITRISCLLKFVSICWDLLRDTCLAIVYTMGKSDIRCLWRWLVLSTHMAGPCPAEKWNGGFLKEGLYTGL